MLTMKRCTSAAAITILALVTSLTSAQTPVQSNSVVPFWNSWVNNADITEEMMVQMLTMARIEVEAVNVYVDYCQALGHWTAADQNVVQRKLRQYDGAAEQFLAQYSEDELDALLGDAQGFNVAREMLDNMKQQFSTDSEADEQSANFCASVSEGIEGMPAPNAIERSKGDF